MLQTLAVSLNREPPAADSYGAAFWFHEPIPPELSWLVSFLGILGLVMAVNPFCQALFGRPKVVIGASAEKPSANAKLLLICVYNRPVCRRILRDWLGVRRESISALSATYSLRRLGSQVPIVEDAFPSLVLTDGVTAQQISLPASAGVCARFAVAKGLETSGVFEFRDATEKFQRLLPGTYIVDVTVHAGEDRVRSKRMFHVSTNLDDFIWNGSG